MSVEYLTKKSTGWFKGCGCGQKQGDKVTAPADSVEIVVQSTNGNSEVTGPVSGAIYRFVPNAIAIDVDPRDAEVFRTQNIATGPRQGLKGYVSRKATE